MPILSAESKVPNNGVANGRVTSDWVADEGEVAISIPPSHRQPEDEAADSGAVDSIAIEKKFVATDSCLGAANAAEGGSQHRASF